jgi:hypothetical protein
MAGSDVIFNFFGDIEARLWFNWLEAKYNVRLDLRAHSS